MRRNFTCLIIVVSVLTLPQVKAQLTPKDAMVKMARGINIGNTFDATPDEGSWGNGKVQEYYFDDYKSAGFTSIRIPITWKFHVMKTFPYTIDPVFLARVDTVVSWGLRRGLMITINAHHEDWLKNNGGNADTLERFDSLWSQIATHFRDHSENLVFEMLNEPNPMSLANVDLINARILGIIRKTNPTRIVSFSGDMWANSDRLILANIPDVNDKYLMGYYHSYDPYPFGLNGPGTYGSAADINATIAKFDVVTNWATTHNIPVVLGEFGAQVKCEYNSRMLYYATVVEQAMLHGVGFEAWDDNGDFQIYLRSSRKWNDIKDILTHYYKESPNQLKATFADAKTKITWVNRTTLNDSIYIDRRTLGTEFTIIGAVIGNANQFIDTSTQSGNTYYYRLRTNLLDSIDLYSYPMSVTVLGTRKPYLGSAVEIPGTIEAENFDFGGLEVAYHTSNNTNQGGAYRPNEGVGIEARPDGFQLDYVTDGEWVSYSIKSPQKRLYKIDTYTASQDGGGIYGFKIGTKNTKNVIVPKTGDWITTAFSTTSGVTIDTGIQILYLRIVSTTNAAFNVDKFIISPDSLTTSVNSLNRNQSDYHIYPNPASSRLIIEKTISNTATLEVYNMIGIKIKTEILSNDRNTISLEGINEGVYLLVLKSGNSIKTEKILIKH